jgi:hypothetical protein
LFFSSLRSEDLRTWFRLLLDVRWGEFKMSVGHWAENVFTADGLALQAVGLVAGASRFRFDKIAEDFPFSPARKRDGRRRIEQADLEGTNLTRLTAPNEQRDFYHLNQRVAAGILAASRQLRIIHPCPEKGRSAMATLDHFCASLPYGVLSGLRQIDDADSMAKPEV